MNILTSDRWRQGLVAHFVDAEPGTSVSLERVIEEIVRELPREWFGAHWWNRMYVPQGYDAPWWDRIPVPLWPVWRYAIAPVVARDWAPADEGTDAETEEPPSGTVYFRAVELPDAALLLPDDEDEAEQFMFEVASPEDPTGETEPSILASLAPRPPGIGAFTIMATHCTRDSSGCHSPRCTCLSVRVRSRRGGRTVQCRCNEHHLP